MNHCPHPFFKSLIHGMNRGVLRSIWLGISLVVIITPFASYGLARPETIYQIYQFSHDSIPCIDGDFSEWDTVPDTYAIGLDQLRETVAQNSEPLHKSDFDITVKVAWVNGLNRLYFYVQAYDDFWDFSRDDLKQEIFELVVDADLSAGPFIKKNNPNQNLIPIEKLHFKGHGGHAQNYHIFMPAVDKKWAMVWGAAYWIKEFPWANSCSRYDFSVGENGMLEMEFWITPFDHCSVDGPDRSIISRLKEGEIIGLSWCVIDYDESKASFDGFMNLAHDTRMIYDASFLNPFRLMPRDPSNQSKMQADWDFVEIDRTSRRIQFMDHSNGEIDAWHWDFGDGNESNSQNPIHQYNEAREWVVTLTVHGSDGSSKMTRVWDVVTE